MKSAAKVPSEFTCDRCSYRGRSKAALYAHKKVHAEKKLRCDLCDYKSQFRRNLTLHNRTHSGEKPFICKFSDCNYSSSQAPNLAQHVLLIHSSGKPFPCKACSKTFKSKHHLNAHVIAKHKGKRPHQCLHNDCEYSSTKITNVKKHVFTHTGERPFRCYFSECDYAGTERHHLTVHIRTHTGEKPNRCSFKGCEYLSARFADMERHALTHSEQKPHRCNFEGCSFASARESSLKNHLLRHLVRNEPFASAKTSCETNQISRPVKSTTLKSTPIEKRSCKICEFKIRKLKKYEAHVQSHRERGHLFCLICDFLTLKQKRFEKHMKTHEATPEWEYNSGKRKSVTSETVTSQHGSCSVSNSLLTLETLTVVNKSGTFTQPAESATEKDLSRQKKLKVYHKLNNNPELQQESNTRTNIQPRPQLEPLMAKTSIIHSAGKKNKLSNLVAIKTEESSVKQHVEGISSTIAKSSFENVDCTHSVLQVKVEPCKKYSCSICEFGTKKKSKYKDHVEVHKKEGRLFCSLCDYVSLDKKLFKKHLRVHRNNLRANIFNLQLTNEDTLLDLDVSIVLSNTVFLQPRSDSDEIGVEESAAVRVSECVDKLPKTKEKETLDGKKTNKCFSCSICDYKTQRKYRLTDHIRIHTGDRPFSCSYSGCDYSSALKCNLTTHLVVIHSDAKPYSCQLCAEAFKTKYLLNSHVINHTGRRPHQCLYENCEYSCFTSNDLKKHTRSHTKEKPYHCYFEGCSFSCSQGNSLKAHIRTHTGERPYPCNFKGCDLSFRKLCHMQNHILKHTGAKPFHCDFNDCKYSSARASYLRVHMLRHLTQNPHACPKCKFRSRTILEIEQHVETHHRLQNTSLSQSHDQFKPDSSQREIPAIALRVPTQSSFGSQNISDRRSETLDKERPNRKYDCARCGFESRSKNKYKAHFDSHGQRNINRTPEDPVTSQDSFSSTNSSQAQKTEQVLTISTKVTESPGTARTAAEMVLPKHKKMKTKHHFKNHPEFRQVSSSISQTQPSVLFKPLANQSDNFRQNRKTNLARLGIQSEEEISAGVEVTKAISPTNAQLFVVSNDSTQSASQVKVKPWRKYSCPICEFGTKKKRKYKEHLELHQKEGYLFCSLCNFASVNSKRFKKHLRTHENGRCDDNNSEIQTSSCSEVRLMRQDSSLDTSSPFLNSHSLPLSDEVIVNDTAAAVLLSEYDSKLLKMSEKGTLDKKKCFCCSVCDYKTQYKHCLTEHTRAHTGDSPFSCTYIGCSYSSALKGNLMRHLAAIHSDEKPYLCQLCAEAFKTKYLLNSHVINHKGKRPHQCLYKNCEYSSTRAYNLRTHIRSHTQEKPYHCYFEGCRYSCSMASHLKAHIRTHTGERPYPCNFKGCSLSFRKLDHLQNHVLTHTGDKPFHCDFNDCKFSSARSDNLKVHMLGHLTKNPHTCPKCKFRSQTSLEIEQHLETFHKLQNASPSRSQPDAQIKESPAEAITNILRVRAQPSFSFQDKNERDSEALDVAKPSKKYICSRCGFNSKSKKKHKTHLESHVKKRQFLETMDTKLKKNKTSSKQGSDISSNRSQTKENITALLRVSKKSLASFPCNFCKKSFSKEMNLLDHLRYHTGQKIAGL